jgi:hypothetical protein
VRIAALMLLAVGALPAADASGVGPEKPAEALYLQLGQVGLDPARVYQVRGASLDRSAVHISLEDGTIGFTQDVMGKVTGAFFAGEGEILLVPPTEVERKSMGLFTGMAILEEHFATAYFRFNDDAFDELRPDLRSTDDKQAFVDHCQETARNLAQGDATRLLESFSRMLPVNGVSPSSPRETSFGAGDRFLHARLQGTKLGVFDVYFDSQAAEQIQVGQAKTADNGVTYYNMWTSFTPAAAKAGQADAKGMVKADDEKPREDWVAIRHYAITTDVQPPKQIHARAHLQLEAKEGGQRVLLFELSRFLQVESVELNSQPVEFIHNPAVEGTQLARRGNDVVAVVLPEAVQAGQKMDLEFVYGGEVLEEEGSGLLYVGARGSWYPNRGGMSNFDLEFNYPQGWTLEATGKPVPVSAAETSESLVGSQSSRWVSERPIPFAGFNLGKYKVVRTRAGDIPVETYATTGVERSFPSVPFETIDPKPSDNPLTPHPPTVIAPHRPSPSLNEGTVGQAAAQAIQYYSERFGPYPYTRLALTQMPGRDSQGWPGLVFLSSYAFLNQQEREALHYDTPRILLQELIPAHETAHQWWGDLVSWETYRDQWFSEGLASYCALMMLQEKNPAGFHAVMEKFRRDLVEKNKDGVAPMDAGPVTLGLRLLSSRFPEGYEAITYGRATWLFHMLRTMMRDAEVQEKGGRAGSGPNEPFMRALLRLRKRYEGQAISTRELLEVFAEDLPPALRYEGKNSLDWFLEGWVNGTALPKLELKGVKFTLKGTENIVSGTIAQKDAPQDLVTSVPLYAAVAGKTQVLLGRVFADGDESSFRLRVPAGTHKILLDPYETILTSPK